VGRGRSSRMATPLESTPGTRVGLAENGKENGVCVKEKLNGE
jgi:hypothetical protein